MAARDELAPPVAAARARSPSHAARRARRPGRRARRDRDGARRALRRALRARRRRPLRLARRSASRSSACSTPATRSTAPACAAATLAPDDPLRGTGTLVALAPDFAACFVVREPTADEWEFAVTYDRDTVVECALPLMARMEPLASLAAARAAELGDHLRELPALPGERRGARAPPSAARRPGSPRRSARRPRTGGRDRPRRGSPRRRRQRRARRARPRPRTARERGTARSASATASGCSCAESRWCRTLITVSRHASGTPRLAVGRDEALDAAGAQPVGERVPALEVARARPRACTRA